MVLGVGWLLTNFPSRFLKVAGSVAVLAGVGHVAKPHIFRFMCDRAFEKIDADHNHHLDHLELQLAVYELYHGINKRLPGWSDPPTRNEILAALQEFDKDGNNLLDKDEFHEFAKKFIKGGDSFFARFGQDTAANAVMLPAVAPFAKNLVGLRAIPDAVATPLLASVVKVAKALNPMGLS
mmetsp:Transcript_19392/g.54009  ORF Transcript_19392/g.54009 Transcript_19392/m.54009 type:complete len:180 (-) Transcript_19392:128-667(-)|eukprot:CAMPEP_0117677002 /NCGR_PEP_ID=MMETSP0804-20121206/16512_1 /TAXON_ID=1074897 /ORGANISM="Tetraselmis astigmatica, Strain CCMP880" /LENGTH=179 /DNA_ID=CAMNT_0005486255 /DNA_START=106 /DNA_END=645 /DNA_ORIENTATION=+